MLALKSLELRLKAVVETNGVQWRESAHGTARLAARLLIKPQRSESSQN